MRPLRFLPFLALLALGSGAPALSGCDSGGEECSSTDTFSTEDITPEGAELGAAIAIGQCVEVDYVGRLADGSGTFDEGTLRRVYAPNNGLIPGFVLGMAGQQIGETRRVVIPPDLAYGPTPRNARSGTDSDGNAYVGIPACSTLEFDITVTNTFQDTRQCGLQ